MRVYVAGPYTLGDRSENMRRIMAATIEILDAGHEPFCPLLTHFLDLTHPRPWEDWMRLDMAWLECAEAFVSIPGESLGADMEADRAAILGIPTFESVADFLEWVA